MGKHVAHNEVAGWAWSVWRGDDGKYAPDQVERAILLDIRAELQKLNAVMQCPNVAKGFRALATVAGDEKAFKRRVQQAVRRELKKRGA